MHPNLPRIRMLSRCVRALCAAGAVCLIVLPACIWSTPEWVAQTAASQWGLGAHAIQLALHNRLLGAAASLLPALVALFVLWQVWSLFGAYGQGQIFTPASVLRLKRVAQGMLCLPLAQPLSVALVGLALTMDNPVGERALILNVHWHDYLALLFGLIMLAIASVMGEAVRVADENAEFI
nr:DUF2975 domain-containing protein [uncultured Roseateles sp.]